MWRFRWRSSPTTTPLPRWPRRSAGSDPSYTERAANHLLHDLVGAAVDRHHAGVHERLGHRLFAQVAVAAVELQAAVDQSPLQLRRPPLGAGRRDRISAARVVGEEALVDVG